MAEKILTVKVDKVDDVLKAFDALTTNRVLIGIPSTTAGRTDGAPINNAAIGYINEFGSPLQNIPPRPFLVPGVRNAQERIVLRLKQGILLAARGNRDAAIRALHAVGMTASSSVKTKIRTGPFTPLADKTVYDRAHRNTTTGRAGARKGALKELANRAAGIAPSTEFTKPLIDTTALLRSITYVIRGRWF